LTTNYRLDPLSRLDSSSRHLSPRRNPRPVTEGSSPKTSSRCLVLTRLVSTTRLGHIYSPDLSRLDSSSRLLALGQRPFKTTSDWLVFSRPSRLSSKPLQHQCSTTCASAPTAPLRHLLYYTYPLFRRNPVLLPRRPIHHVPPVHATTCNTASDGTCLNWDSPNSPRRYPLFVWWNRPAIDVSVTLTTIALSVTPFFSSHDVVTTSSPVFR
jgi:hypothetical protein